MITWKYVKPLKNPLAAKEFWEAHKVQLPEGLKQCLVNNNGGRPSVFLFDTETKKEYVFQSLFSYNEEDKCNIFSIYPGEFKDTALFPIGLEAAGNIVCYEMNKEKYVLWIHEKGEIESILM